MTRSYLWNPPHSYLFPRPYVPEDFNMVLEQISPFPYSINMEKDNTKTTAVSLMKHLNWLGNRRESQPFLTSTGEDYFAAEKKQRRKASQSEEDAAWVDVLTAADNLTRLKTKRDAKRARFQSPSPRRQRKVYRKTPPFNPSLRTCQASPCSSPCLSSSSPLSSALRPLEQTSLSETNALVR